MQGEVAGRTQVGSAADHTSPVRPTGFPATAQGLETSSSKGWVSCCVPWATASLHRPDSHVRSTVRAALPSALRSPPSPLCLALTRPLRSPLSAAFLQRSNLPVHLEAHLLVFFTNTSFFLLLHLRLLNSTPELCFRTSSRALLPHPLAHLSPGFSAIAEL